MIIRCPLSFPREREYIYQVLWQEFLGLPYRIVRENRMDVVIVAADSPQRQLQMGDSFFQTAAGAWLTTGSLPIQPLAVWAVEQAELVDRLVDRRLPVIYGKPATAGQYLTVGDDSIQLGVDVAGSAFFMLTRYEELVKCDYDRHGRFAAGSSLAYQEGFLDRPIVNEYLEVLWWCLQRLWPSLRRKQRQFAMIATHDVDYPFAYAFTGWRRTVRSMAADLLKRRSVSRCVHRLVNTWQVKAGDYRRDENYTFDAIMKLSEQHGMKSRFYFMADHQHLRYDPGYSLGHPFVQALMRHICERGHEIGLHPSYESYGDSGRIASELAGLREVCRRIGISQPQVGGRQHYLRWQPETWQYYEEAGLTYDTSLAYADQIGFRCGVCYSYPVYNVKSRRRLRLYERPLLIMDCSVLATEYMALPLAEAVRQMQALKEITRKYGGEFVYLWHNDRLVDVEQLAMYQSLFS